MECYKKEFGSKKASFYKCSEAKCPLVILLSYEEEGKELLSLLQSLTKADFNLLEVSSLNWEEDLSCWPSKPIFSSKDNFTGKADEFLTLLLSQILPYGEGYLQDKPSDVFIAGYSMAGLFALYSLYRTSSFTSCVSASGSLWYPNFYEYALINKIERKPDFIYLSLGDRESLSKNGLLKRNRSINEGLKDEYLRRGIKTTFVLNEGNHFKDADLRLAKGIVWVLENILTLKDRV
jgi:predicted alpha/beta superfamily hydrolase